MNYFKNFVYGNCPKNNLTFKNLNTRAELFNYLHKENIGEYKMNKILEIRTMKRYYQKIHDMGLCGCYPRDAELGCPYECLAYDEEWALKRWNGLTRPEKDKELLHAYDVLGEQPPVNGYFMTISPGWKTTDKQLEYSKDLKRVLKQFARQTKYFKKIECVIELGGNNDHPHAHIVFIPLVKYMSTVKTYVSKGNLHRSIRKVWKDLQLDTEVLKDRHALKTNYFIPEYLQDKLDYLEEDKKPEDHKNPLQASIFGEWEHRFTL